MNNSDKFLLIQPKAGMGMRIEATLTGILFGRLTGRIMFIDWSDPEYSEDKSDIFRKLFSLSNVNYIQGLPNIDQAWHRNGNACRKKSFKKSSILTLWTNQLSENIDCPQKLLILRGGTQQIEKLRPYFKGAFARFQEMDTDAIFKELLTEHLTLNKDIRKQVDDFKKRYFNGWVLGIHVRYTDRKIPLRLYSKTINTLLNKYPNAKIFLSTDNREITDEYRKKYGDILTTKKWYRSMGNFGRDFHAGCPDRIQAGIEALIDMYLLAECDAFIYTSHSTFGTLPKAILRTAGKECFDVEDVPSVVSVIVPVLDFHDSARSASSETDSLKDCMEGLEKQTYPKDFYEVIIAHNGLSDEIRDFMMRANKKATFKLLGSCVEDTTSVYALRNKGIAEARGDMIAFISPDCIPHRDWIKNGVKNLRKIPTRGLIIGKIENPDRNKTKLTAVETYQHFFYKAWMRSSYYNYYVGFIEKCGFGLEDNIFAYKHVFEDTGPFDGKTHLIGDFLWWRTFNFKTPYYSYGYAGNVCVLSRRRITSFAELYKKIVCVAEECHNSRKIRTYTPRMLIRHILFPLKAAYQAWSLDNIKGFRAKVKFISVLLFVSYVRIGHRIRLQIRDLLVNVA